MRNELLAAALSLSLVACIEKQPKVSEPKQEVSMVETKAENRGPKLDFEHIYDETNGKQRFSREVTKEEEDLFYDKWLDDLDRWTQADKDRFNRKLREPKLGDADLKEREKRIQKLLDQCVELIGSESGDGRYALEAQEGNYAVAIIESRDSEFQRRVQPSYLTGRMLKCINYLYLDSYFTEIKKLSTEQRKKQIAQQRKENWSAYDFSDFEYPNKNHKIPEKKQKIEKLYEQIYLEIKDAGLLRKIFYTYYPKSFLREYADQTGLTKFIEEKETKAGKPLKHDELAIEFFGSREKWIEGFDQFLDKKIIKMKQGVQ